MSRREIVSDLVCPVCGTDDDLAGEPEGEGIRIACAGCDIDWFRDPRPRCPTCDGDDLEGAAKAVVEKSRGTQLSIVGIEVIQLCRRCDHDVLVAYRIHRTAIMPDELPTT